MNIRAMVGSHEVQNVLKIGLSSMEDDLAVVNDPNARKRDKKEACSAFHNVLIHST